MTEKAETFRVKKTGNQIVLNLELQMISFLDAETKMRISYIPSLDISGYGDNKAEADEMVKEALKTYLAALSKLSMKAIDAELAKYNWSKQKINTKIYRPSVSFKDILKQKKITKYTSSSLKQQVAA